MSIERQGAVLRRSDERFTSREVVAHRADLAAPADAAPASMADGDEAAVEFVRFCYRRRAVAWPELYDEMCAVARRGDFRGLDYEELESLGIGLALAALPRMADLVGRVIAEERSARLTVLPGVA